VSEKGRGTSVSGTPGVTTYEKDADLMATLKGDPSIGKTLNSPDPTQKYLNRMEYAKSISEKYNAMAAEKGLKFDEASAHGSFGLEAFGLGASAQVKTGSRHQQETNVIMGAVLRNIDSAERDAIQKGMTGSQADTAITKRMSDMAKAVDATVRYVKPVAGSYIEKQVNDMNKAGGKQQKATNL